MTDVQALRRLALFGVALAAVIGVPSTAAFVAAWDWNFEAAIFGDPSVILGRGPQAAHLLRWGAIGDMFYSYLLLAPLALYLRAALRSRMPWLADVGSLAAFAYIFVGAAGAAILAIVGSSLVEGYAAAAPAERFAIATSFEMLRNVVFFALWQMLDAITLGTWVLSVGWLIRMDRPKLGRLLVVVGMGIIAASLMTMFGVHSLELIGIGGLAVLVSWAAWVVFDRPSAADPPR
jgi:hypothetical protein